MKNYFQFIRNLHERLDIYNNPNAFEPNAGEVESPRARKLRHEFDRKLRAAGTSKGYKEAMSAAWAKIREKRKAAAAKPPRAPYPWGNKGSIAGWWNPKLENYTFSHSTGYHVTQIVRNPSRFGISPREMYEGLKKESDYYNERHLGWYDKDGEENPYTPERVKERIEKEDIDLAYEVQRVAYIKGWLKVYSGNTPSLEGINRESIKAALREILAVRPEIIDLGGSVEIFEVGLVRNTQKLRYLRGKEILHYLNS